MTQRVLRAFKDAARNVAARMGYDIVPLDGSEFPADFDRDMIDLYRRVRPYTMTSKERLFALRSAVEYVVRHEIPGDIVECGVWRGGSMMAVAQTLLELGDLGRRLYLFDTFTGMTNPEAVDQDAWGRAAQDKMHEGWCASSLEEVRKAMRTTGYDAAKCVFVEGKVEDTIPAHAPAEIALLRLDTDWYGSTCHELTHLYPRLSPGGVLLIDDYGHWQGARRAVDEYLARHQIPLLLQRIDYTGRIAVKPGYGNGKA